MSLLAQRLLMASGGKKDSTYIEDVFSTYLYKGNASERAIINGIKLGNSGFGNSVDFDGTANQLNIPDSDDWDLGNGDFTLETWVKSTQTTSGYFTALGPWTTHVQADGRDYSWCIRYASQDIGTGWSFFYSTTGQNYVTTMGADISDGQWHHIAVCRSGNNLRTFTDGVLNTTRTTTDTFYNSGTTMKIGGQSTVGNYFDGQLSNVRLVKGTALYTANFTPPTKELTSIENTKLLCCNQSTVTGATVTPGTITVSGGNPITSAGPFTASDGKGGMVWIKDRTNSYNHVLQDTERGAGATKKLSSNLANAENDGDNALQWSGYISAFNNSGFSLDKTGSGSINWANVNKNNDEYASWTFVKQKGFFDIQTWDGNNTPGRQLPHNLGSVPGCIMVKSTDGSSADWMVYHREIGATHRLKLNSTTNSNTTASWNDVVPTSTYVELGSNTGVNASGRSYVGYFFAGGASDEPGSARSVDFDGSGDYLTQTCDAVLRNWWDQAFTVEYWVNADGFVSSGNGGPGVLGVCAPTSNGETWSFGPKSNGTVEFYYWNGSIQQVTTTRAINVGQWYHLAMVYDGSSSIKIYINGILEKSATVQGTPTGSSTVFSIGKIANGSEFNGKVSNVRIAHQALYTSSFRPPTKGLTNITNTKLLCCNKNTVTGSTITPSTISTVGDPQSSTSTPFDDPAGFKFGEGGDQNLIKCGSYVGQSGANTVNLGWEPQWVMVKNIDSEEPWVIMDSMRGWVNQSSGAISLRANSTGNELAYGPWGPTATGWELDLNQREIDMNEQNYVYIAIRQADGLVSKLPEVGTDVFALNNSPNGSTTTPAFISGFPVEFAMYKHVTHTSGWYQGARIIAKGELKTSSNAAVGNMNWFTWDSNEGWGVSFSSNQSWMWRRYAGFEVVTYKGKFVANTQMPHNLGREPEMIWIKDRDQAFDWLVGHNGLNEGTNPWNYGIKLNTNGVEWQHGSLWSNTAPTSTYFTLGANADCNFTDNYIAFLFASVEGISKVGNYTGTTSNNPIDLGFTPRFIMIKRVDVAGDWLIFDTLRGILSALSGNAEQIYTHELSTQQTYSWTCPAGVTSVSVVAVGAGGGGIGAGNGQNYGIGGGGGGLGYKNNISVTAGQSYTVKVGAKGQAGPSGGPTPTGPAPNEGDSYFIDASTVRGGGGEGGYSSSNGGRGGDYTGDGGGNGGRGGPSVNSGGNKGGGGGAGGYAGNGGDGMNAGGNGGTGTDGSGGAGGGSFGGGGGVGLNGQGDSGNFSWNNGAGGSGGDVGGGYAQGGWGGNYGGGGGCVDNNRSQGSLGGQGAVRIIWNTAGHARSFPNTNVGTFEDKILKLNENHAQIEQDCVSTTASGMTLIGADSLVNVNGGKYIYYAHA